MSRRLASVLLFAALAVLGGCKETLYNDLGEREVNEMLAVLQGNGIDSGKVAGTDGRYRLQVADGQLARAVSLLRDRGYPSETFASMGDVFKGDGLLASPQEEWARYVYALSQSLSETLVQIDGVITARVHLVLPDNNPKAAGGAPSAASVFIKYDPDAGVDAAKADIKRIVEKSVEGLDYGKISVVMVAAQPLLEQAPRPLAESRPVYASVWSGVFGIGTLFALTGLYLWRRRHMPAFGLRGAWQGESTGHGAASGEVFDADGERR